ncbi:MAG TPA: sporulation integral membrane protein YtvI [Bacilli bacterium]|nr:sporulation integral membrane protein YtvI [Bacilli bacterium]
MFPYMRIFWIAVLVVAGYFILPHSLPILLALITAVVLEPLVKMLQKGLRIKRTFAVLAAFLGFLLLIGGLLYLLTTRMIIEVVELSQWLPHFFVGLSEPVQNWAAVIQEYFSKLSPETTDRLMVTVNSLLDSLNNLTVTLLNGLVNLIKSLPDLLVTTVVYIIALFLFSVDLPTLHKKFLSLFEADTQQKVEVVLKNLNRAIIGFLQAQVLISFLTYDLVLVGLWILGVHYALAVALIIVLVDILPVLGTGAVIVPWATYAFLKDNETLGIGLLILYVVIIVFRRIVEPKILGNSLGISALATLISMYLGFMILGFLGLIVGPALVIIVQAFREAGFFNWRIKL